MDKIKSLFSKGVNKIKNAFSYAETTVNVRAHQVLDGIESFKANGTDAGLFEYQVFIDSVNKSIYFQTNENDVYGVYVKKF